MRRLLLTSNGIRNEALRSALAGLVGKPIAKASAAVISTAPDGAAGDHDRLTDDLDRLRGLGWRKLDTLDLNSLPAATVIDRLWQADVVYARGDNPYLLAGSIIANGLDGRLAEILESKVWVGAGAGSMIFSRFLSRETGEAFGDHDELRELGETPVRSPFGLFNWYVEPRLNAADFPGRTPERVEQVAAKASFPVYALDDDSAIRVRGDTSAVVSEGQWLLLNAPYSRAFGGTSALRPFTSERSWRLPTFRASYRFVRRLARR
jgi:dipeptidase E